MSRKRRKKGLKKKILRIEWVRDAVNGMPPGFRRFIRNKYAVGSAVILVAIFVVILVALSISTKPEESAAVETVEEEGIIYVIDEQGNRVAVSAVDDDSLVLQNEKYAPTEDDPTILSYNESTREGYMNNCIFLGDSRTVAMVSYGFVSDANALAKIGISHWQVLSTTFTQNSGKQYTLSDYLRSHSEPVIYVCYGVNGLNGMPEEKYESTYTELVDRIIELAGDRHIVLMSIWPVDDNGRYRGSVKNEWVDKYNDFLYRLAVEKGLYYLDVASILKDDSGSIKKEYDSGDGLHYKASAYNDILDYIIHHPVPGVSDEGEFVVHYVKPRGEYKEIMTETPTLPQTTQVEPDDISDLLPGNAPEETETPSSEAAYESSAAGGDEERHEEQQEDNHEEQHEEQREDDQTPQEEEKTTESQPDQEQNQDNSSESEGGSHEDSSRESGEQQE